MKQFRGKVAANTGDGLISIFDGAERAVRCGVALSAEAAQLVNAREAASRTCMREASSAVPTRPRAPSASRGRTSC